MLSGKQKIKSGYLLVFLALCSLFFCGTALADEFAMVYNTTAAVNVRTGPDTSYARVGQLHPGDFVQVLGESGNWYYLRAVNGTVVGYASKTYLTRGTAGAWTGEVSNPKPTQFLNLREYPSTAAKVLGIYYNGDEFTVLDTDYDGWCHVRIDGMEGYFMTSYVKLHSGTGAVISTQNGGSLNMRTGPSASYTVCGAYANGTRVSVLLQGNDFCLVSVNGNTGFMASQYLRFSSSPQPTPTPTPSPVTSSGYCVITNRFSSYVNMRKSASGSAKIIMQCKNGLKYEMLMAGRDWCKVYGKSSGNTGYVMTKYVTLYDCSIYRTVRNGTSYVNLRSGSGKNTRVLRQVSSGTVVTVIAPGDTWCKVSVNGTEGYMMTQFLK